MTTRELLVSNKRWSALLDSLKSGESYMFSATATEANTIRAIASRQARGRGESNPFLIRCKENKIFVVKQKFE